MNPVSALIVLFAPTYLARYLIDEDDEGRIKNAWRIHKNRQAQNLGGTYQKDAVYNDKMNELHPVIHGIDTTFLNAFRGDLLNPTFYHPFVKFHKDFE